jgi:hypothetical protein
MPRHAGAMSLKGAATALAAGAVALALLRRMVHKSSGPVNRQPQPGTSSAATGGAHGPVSASSERAVDGGADDERPGGDLRGVDPSALAASAGQPAEVDRVASTVSEAVKRKNEPFIGGEGSSRSTGQERPALTKRRVVRMLGYTRQGLVPVVWALLVITAAFAVFGWVNRPDTRVPQPEEGNIEVDFEHGHPATSPVIALITLFREDISNEDKGGVLMTVVLKGVDLKHRGWSIMASVPGRVYVNGVANNPDSGQGMSDVYMAPGPQSDGKFEADFEWSDLASGALQVIGATTTAALPRLVVINQTLTRSELVPSPALTVNYVLTPGGDFTYQSGPMPAQIVGYDWQWKPVTGTVNESDLDSGFSVEAKSAYLDGKDHIAEFYSGIAFGISAAAGVTCIVEFLKAKRKNPKDVDEADEGMDVLDNPRLPQNIVSATLDADG